MHTKEFQHFKLEYYSLGKEKKRVSGGKKRLQVRETLPRKIREIQLKYQQGTEASVLKHDVYSNPMYRPDLEKKILHRRQQSFDLKDVYERVRKQVNSNHEQQLRK